MVGVEGEVPMKWVQLNRALDDWLADGPVATVDDDIVRCIRVADRREVPPLEVAENIAAEMAKAGLKLGGPYNGTNTSWAGGTPRTFGAIPGAMMVHAKGCKVRFSPYAETGWLDDLDLNLQHHTRYGGALVHGGYCIQNEWNTNAGGYQLVRSPDKYRWVTEIMTRKWGRWGCKFGLNPTSRNGLSIRVPWRKIVAKVTGTPF